MDRRPVLTNSSAIESVRRLPSGVLPDQLDAFLLRAGGEWFRGFYRNDAAVEASHLKRRLIAHNIAGQMLLESRGVGGLQALAVLERMKWDSTHFGLDMYRVAPVLTDTSLPPEQQNDVIKALHSGVLEAAQASGAGLLLRRLRSSRLGEIRTLEELGYRLADNVVTMTAKVPTVETNLPVGVTFRALTVADVPIAQALMNGSFSLSRFCLEPILQARGEAVYSQWLNNAFDVGASPMGRVVECGGQFAGFTMWTRDAGVSEEVGHTLALLDLFVVGAQWRGRGLGVTLLADTLREMARTGAQLVEASTWIGQYAAMATYQKLGFAVRENLLSFHLDLKKTA